MTNSRSSNATPQNMPVFDRGEPARRALLLAGAQIFGEKGLEGATTRQIAAKAQQNISAIKYYFDSKEGLYLAIAREIGTEIGLRIGQFSKRLDSRKDALNPRHAMDLLKELITVMLHTIMARDLPAIYQFVVHEQQNPTPAFSVIYEASMRTAHETITALIAIAFDLQPRAADTVLRAHALVGQVLGFRAARAALLRRTGWSDVGPVETEAIVNAVTAGLELMFAGRRQRKAAARPPKRAMRSPSSRSKKPSP